MVQDKQSRARHLYMADAHSQRDIAQKLQVSERTLYTWIKANGWDRLRRAARTAPIAVADNLYSELVELQDAIAAREVGNRYPTLHEAEIIRKLVTCIDRMKKTNSLSQNMQMLHLFKSFARDQDDRRSNWKLEGRIDRFLEADARDGYYPYQPEYDTKPTTEAVFHDDEDVPEESPEMGAGNSAETPSASGTYTQPPFVQQTTPFSPTETLSHSTLQPTSAHPEKPEEVGSISEVSRPSAPRSLDADTAFLHKSFPTRLSALRRDGLPPG